MPKTEKEKHGKNDSNKEGVDNKTEKTNINLAKNYLKQNRMMTNNQKQIEIIQRTMQTFQMMNKSSLKVGLPIYISADGIFDSIF